MSEITNLIHPYVTFTEDSNIIKYTPDEMVEIARMVWKDLRDRYGIQLDSAAMLKMKEIFPALSLIEIQTLLRVARS